MGTSKSGCFVRLAGGVSGRVLLKLLSDRYVSNPTKEFPAGRLVAGKVLKKVGYSGATRFAGGDGLLSRLVLCLLLIILECKVLRMCRFVVAVLVRP